MAIICNVPNREYIRALQQCAKEHENDKLFTGQINVSDLCNDTAKLLENDVIERSKVDKAFEELQNMKIYDHTVTARLVSLPEVFEILKRNIGDKYD